MIPRENPVAATPRPARLPVPGASNPSHVEAWRRAVTSTPENPPAKQKPRPPPDSGYQYSDEVPAGRNNFTLQIKGDKKLLSVGGSEAQQREQRDKTVVLSAKALESYATGHTPLTPRAPSDAKVDAILSGLKPNPPIEGHGASVTGAKYVSEIPNATPSQAYEHFRDHPGEVFNAGGMEIRGGPPGRLKDDAKYMLEIGGPVPTWLPVQMKTDDARRQITIQTLDGHVLRGTQTFTFNQDGLNKTKLVQDAHFQASSDMVGDIQHAASVEEGQHLGWQYAHQEIYDQFNGKPDDKGLGVGLLNGQQTGAWKDIARNVADHPLEAAKKGLEGVGQAAKGVISVTLTPTVRAIDAAEDKLEARAKKAIDHLPPAARRVGRVIDGVENTAENSAKSAWHWLTR